MATLRADQLAYAHDGKRIHFICDGTEHRGTLDFEHFDHDEYHWRINYIDDNGKRIRPLVPIGTLIDIED